MSIVVKRITEIEEVIRILKPFESCQWLGIPETMEDKTEFAEKQITCGNVIAEYHNEEPVGFACFFNNDNETKKAFVTRLAVRDNLGMARSATFYRLCKRILEISEESGMEAIRLEVANDNDKAKKLYEQMGFCYTGENGENGPLMEMPIMGIRERFKKELKK